MPKQSWNAETYKSSMQAVEALAAPALALLENAKGKDLLDLGCGDGRLTQALIARGYHVTAVDASAELVSAARERGIKAIQMDARELPFVDQFDIVFSHAVLHWIMPPEKVIAAISHALKPGGWFIAQFGGRGDAQVIRSNLIKVMRRRGYEVASLDPWYNPAADEYDRLLEKHGLKPVKPTQLAPWNYPLPEGIHGYVETFFNDSLLSSLHGSERKQAIDEAVILMKPYLCDSKGNWHADFVRLTVCARKMLPQ